MGAARPLFKITNTMSDQEKIRSLEARLVKERALRKQAELNARRFHALMLKARIELITKKGSS